LNVKTEASIRQQAGLPREGVDVPTTHYIAFIEPGLATIRRIFPTCPDAPRLGTTWTTRFAMLPKLSPDTRLSRRPDDQGRFRRYGGRRDTVGARWATRGGVGI
jgi:hypothetical protein